MLNSADLTEVVRCELIVKKCLTILLYGAGVFTISNNDMYRLHIAYRKIFRYIFNLPLWAHISELLEVFNVKPIANLLKDRELNMFKQCFASQFNELSHLASHVIKMMYNMLHIYVIIRYGNAFVSVLIIIIIILFF